MVKAKIWNEDDDNRLGNMVMEYVQNGDTKTAAFKKAAEKLDRTEAACRYRWNAVLKEQFELKQPHNNEANVEDNEKIHITPTASITLKQVIVFLKIYEKQNEEKMSVLTEHELLKKEQTLLISEQKELQQKINRLEQKQAKQQQEYELLMRIVNEAKDIIEDEEMMVH